MRGSAWPARCCTSSSETPCSSRSVMTVTRKECGESRRRKRGILEPPLHHAADIVHMDGSGGELPSPGGRRAESRGVLGCLQQAGGVEIGGDHLLQGRGGQGSRATFRCPFGGVDVSANCLIRRTSSSVKRRQLFLSRDTSATFSARSQRLSVIGAMPIKTAASVRV